MRLDDDLRYFETQEFKKILARYEAAREAGSSIYMDADELTDVAEYYTMVLNNDDLANEAIELAIHLHPDAVDPLIFQARQLMLNGKTEAAKMACDQIPDQQHREVLFLRAELMVRDGKNEEAVNYLLDCSDGIMEDRDYFLFDSAYIFIDYHDYVSAHLLASELEKMAPKWFKTWELLADIYLGESNNEQALVNIEKMLDKDPFYIDAWNWRSEAYCGLSDYTKAFESTDFALAVDPQNERALELKAWVLMRQENFEGAHLLYIQLRKMNPESEIHCIYDSYCLFDMGKIDESLRLIERAEMLAEGMSPEQPAIFEHHAHILSELSRVDEALHYIDLAEQAARSDQAKPEDQQQDFDYYRARIYADNGETELALKQIEIIAGKNNENVETVVFQGALIFFEAGDYRVSLELMKQLMRHSNDDALKSQCYPYLAACNHETGNSEECLENIRLAIENNSPEMKETLGYLFAEGVQPAEYYDYYYYKISGHWKEID